MLELLWTVRLLWNDAKLSSYRYSIDQNDAKQSPYLRIKEFCIVWKTLAHDDDVRAPQEGIERLV